MTNTLAYHDYLQKVDECLHFRNNPDRATIVVQALNSILQRYNAIEYNKWYFVAFYNDLFLHSRDKALEYNVSEMLEIADFFFNEVLQQQLATLSSILDRFTLILRGECDTYWNQKFRGFLAEVETNDFFNNTISRVDVIMNLQQKAKQILNEYRYA